jgi:DNA primase
MIGRTIAPGARKVKYLALPGPKPLLGWEAALGACGQSAAVSAGDAALPADEANLLRSGGAPCAVVVEGVFDWLALRGWGYPAVALVGTHVRADLLDALRGFQRLYLVLDNDAAGRTATCALLERFADRAIPVTLDGVKDVADLAVQPDGRSRFAAAIRAAAAAAAVRPVLSAAA